MVSSRARVLSLFLNSILADVRHSLSVYRAPPTQAVANFASVLVHISYFALPSVTWLGSPQELSPGNRLEFIFYCGHENFHVGSTYLDKLS